MADPTRPADDVANFEFYRDAFKRGDIDAIVKRLKESQRRWAAERVSRRRALNDGHEFVPDDRGDHGWPSYTCAICGKRKGEHSDGDECPRYGDQCCETHAEEWDTHNDGSECGPVGRQSPADPHPTGST